MSYKELLRKQQKKKKNKKRKNEEEEDDSLEEKFDEKLDRFRKNYKNKQHVLILATKGIGQRYRHLMLDLRSLLPHSKSEQKCDPRELPLINEICEIKGCTSAIIFEARRRGDMYMWITKTPSGPSIKFQVLNVHTMKELKFTGNCLKGSRPIVSFDETFDTTPHFRLMKEVFKHVFPTPNYHPKSKPFIDHCINFYIHDDRIWFRNYQITGEQAEETTALVEIGPHFVLNPIKILSGSFYGALLWENPNFVSPAALRGLRKINIANARNVNAKKKSIKSRETDILATASRSS